jgi:hypothetical protein
MGGSVFLSSLAFFSQTFFSFLSSVFFFFSSFPTHAPFFTFHPCRRPFFYTHTQKIKAENTGSFHPIASHKGNKRKKERKQVEKKRIKGQTAEVLRYMHQIPYRQYRKEEEDYLPVAEAASQPVVAVAVVVAAVVGRSTERSIAGSRRHIGG